MEVGVRASQGTHSPIQHSSEETSISGTASVIIAQVVSEVSTMWPSGVQVIGCSGLLSTVGGTMTVCIFRVGGGTTLLCRDCGGCCKLILSRMEVVRRTWSGGSCCRMVTCWGEGWDFCCNGRGYREDEESRIELQQLLTLTESQFGSVGCAGWLLYFLASLEPTGGDPCAWVSSNRSSLRHGNRRGQSLFGNNQLS